MKKTYNIYFVFATLLLLIVPVTNVHASKLTSKDLAVTCIYNDGKAIIKNYDTIADTYYATLSESYPVRNSKKLTYDVSKYKLINLTDGCDDINVKDGCKTSMYNTAIAKKLNYTCPNTFRRYLVDELDETGENREKNVWYYYSISTDGNYKDWLNGKSCRSKPEGDNRVHCYLRLGNKYSIFGASSENTDVITIGENGNVSQKINLVAERITVISDVQPTAMCNYVYTAKQGVGSNKYITIYSYYEGEGSRRLYLDDGNEMTSINGGVKISNTKNNDTYSLSSIVASDSTEGNAIGKFCATYASKICVKTSTKTQSQVPGTSEYEFNISRHDVQSYDYKNNTCPSGYVEYQFSNTGKEGIQTSGSLQQICDSIPKTAFVLSKVFTWIQIIVPALVIVYTGIDIGKIVISGNLDEELPKRKKSIMIRMIVMISFFFIPLFIKVILNGMYGADIGGIECIVDGSNSESENASNELQKPEDSSSLENEEQSNVTDDQPEHIVN